MLKNILKASKCTLDISLRKAREQQLKWQRK
jgi:hypothetical protein